MSARIRPVPLAAFVVAVLVAASCGDRGARSSDDAPAGPATSGDAAATVAVTVEGTEATPAATATDTGSASVATATAVTPATMPPVTATTPPPLAPGADPADQYLGGTTEVYRRALDDGADVVVRMSDAPYATVFGIGWFAPTGSAAKCLGDHALFLGVPGRMGWWGSAWTATPWNDDPVADGEVRFLHTMPAGDDSMSGAEFLLVEVAADATEVDLLSADGDVADRAVATDGLAVLQYDTEVDPEAPFASLFAVVGADGTTAEPRLIEQVLAERPGCGPGEPPVQPLPDAGALPDDPAAARGEVIDRLLTLVDTSIPYADKPSGLLDDDRGVPAAIAGLADSPFAEVAASAEYAVDELVFTAPDEAWFRYTITTSASTWPDRFGSAVLRDGAWRITRATLCQDLSLALSPCSPDPGPVQLPPDPEWQAAWTEWASRASLYTAGDGCPPLSPC